jgi:hypothetical protein
VAVGLPRHLPELDGAELDADGHARAHGQRHEPGLLLPNQLRRDGAVQARLPPERDARPHRGPVALVHRRERAAAELRAVERRRHLAAVVVDADAPVWVGRRHVHLERVGHRHRRRVHVEAGGREPVHVEVGDLGLEHEVQDPRRGAERDDEDDEDEQGPAHTPAARAATTTRWRGQRRWSVRQRSSYRQLLVMAGFRLASAGLVRRRRAPGHHRVDFMVVSRACAPHGHDRNGLGLVFGWRGLSVLSRVYMHACDAWVCLPGALDFWRRRVLCLTHLFYLVLFVFSCDACSCPVPV